MRLLNVRLSEEDAAKVAALRRQGLNLSDLVRSAIRTEYERRRPRRGRKESAKQLLERIYAKYPDPPDLPYEPIDLTDRHAVRAAILKQLTKKRPLSKRRTA